LGVRKERIFCTTVCKKKQPTNWFVLDVLLVMCTTLFSPLLAAYQLILVHSQEKKLPALSHLCHTRWSLQVCEFTATEYKAILEHGKSRWLSLLSAVKRPMDVSFYLASLPLLCWIVPWYSEEFSSVPLQLSSFISTPVR
jgi:hypothetical protein